MTLNDLTRRNSSINVASLDDGKFFGADRKPHRPYVMEGVRLARRNSQDRNRLYLHAATRNDVRESEHGRPKRNGSLATLRFTYLPARVCTYACTKSYVSAEHRVFNSEGVMDD